MNFKEFLLDNYIWILVVVLLTIVTIIGFLVDKKRGNKQNNNLPNMGMVPTDSMNPQPNNVNNQAVNVANQQPLINQNFQQGINQNAPLTMTNQNTIQSVNQLVNQTVPQPILNTPANQDNFVYQPLSEQKPMFNSQTQPTPIPGVVNGIPNVISPSIPEVIPTPIPQPNNNAMNQNAFQGNVNSRQGGAAPEQINVIPSYGQVPYPVNTPNVNQPQMQQANMNNSFNQNFMTQGNQLPVNNNNNQMVNNSSIPQPVSFVYGPQNNGQN